MKAYIFDLDGTLLDSMGIWEQIDVDFLAKRGLALPADFIGAISAMSFGEAAAYSIERFHLPDSVDDLLAEWKRMVAHAYGNTVALKPHARDYLVALKERGAKLAVATSLSAALYEAALRNNGVLHLFDAFCSSDELAFGKSKPDIFLLTAQRLGVDPADCVVFEDIPEAVKSAKQAGMTVYGVYDEASKAHWASIKEMADGVIVDFADAPLPR